MLYWISSRSLIKTAWEHQPRKRIQKNTLEPCSMEKWTHAEWKMPWLALNSRSLGRGSRGSWVRRSCLMGLKLQFGKRQVLDGWWWWMYGKESTGYRWPACFTVEMPPLHLVVSLKGQNLTRLSAVPVMKLSPQALDLNAGSPALDFGNFRRWVGLHWDK